MTAGTQYVFDGAAWQAANTPPATPANIVQDYATSQNVNKPAGARYAMAEGVSGGQAGGTTRGGRGGNYGSMLIDASTLPDIIALTIGAGGATAEAAGGDTLFGPLTVRGAIGLLAAISSSITFDRDGGAAGNNSTQRGCNSILGAGGGGATGGVPGGTGGTGAAAAGALQAGNGGYSASAGSAPGGGGGGGSPTGLGAPGALRLTWIF